MTKLEELNKEKLRIEAQIEREIKLQRKLTPAMELAEALHKKLCHYNHTDGCGWFYGNWVDNLQDRDEYLKKANKILSLEVSLDVVWKILEIV